ncbi:MAG TPA: hypothetical protein VF138_08040 [Caulobacteraceae bacterium]
MNRLVLLAAGAALLTLTACQREVRMQRDEDAGTEGQLRTISRLDCPQEEGDLTLVSAAPDGQSCAYTGEGAEVTLRLVALQNGDARAALAPIEAELKGVIPPPAKAAPTAPAADWNADDVTGKSGERAEVNFPGLHIKADEGGANIRVGGVKIDADHEGGAQIQVGGQTVVNANDGGAEIRTGNARKGGVRSTYILASDKAASGYRVAGYEARGPSAGPLVVAVVKAKGEGHDRKFFNDMKDLVERNVGE